MDGMNVYDFAPDLDCCKLVEGCICGVNAIEGSFGLVYGREVPFVDVKHYIC